MVNPSRLAALLIAVLLGSWSSPGRAQSVRLESPLVQEFRVQPGGSYNGSLVLINRSQESRQVRIYQQDYFRHDPDRISFTDPGKQVHPRSNVAWIGLSTAQVTLGPGEMRDVGFTVQVPPAGAMTSDSGTFWSSIMAEAVEPVQTASDPQTTARGYRVSVQPVFRTSTLVVTQLPTSGGANVSFVDLRVTDPEQNGAARLAVDFRNDGQSAIRPRRMWVEFYDLEGAKRAEVDLTETPIILPANLYRRYVDLSSLGVVPGEYRCLVVVDAGESELFGTQGQILIPNGRS